ncbi:Metal-sulfur cluster biosynthetic enzyme [Nakamurella panacisegetis]|uniref:Metal-sulfur cluster biosynthetic enzyme n=1 Tax=Nakamurella panacisegetis TaxID=1090615 RepID=A0A1H0SG60_9ACTN|nr:metal-sulfur cluster assembly factor [Nakamurella panacisegetis]SDP40680.1 Metal-sulfur cluster biosynthetic enzyme [Nakamurella panacisegetis]
MTEASTHTHDHTGHDHAGHDHADHDHAGHDHSGHDHGSDDRAARGAAALDQVQVTPAVPVDGALIEDIEEALRDVVDPELGVNIVDLGLIYDLTVNADRTLTIDMTLTSAACPLTDMIEDQVGAALMTPGEELVADYKINWVWLPPWGPEKITDDGREQLRALGFNI